MRQEAVQLFGRSGWHSHLARRSNTHYSLPLSPSFPGNDRFRVCGCGSGYHYRYVNWPAVEEKPCRISAENGPFRNRSGRDRLPGPVPDSPCVANGLFFVPFTGTVLLIFLFNGRPCYLSCDLFCTGVPSALCRVRILLRGIVIRSHIYLLSMSGQIVLHAIRQFIH